MFTTLKTYAELQFNQWRPAVTWLGRRDRRLARLVAHAYATVPYYREKFDAAGVAPADIRTAADLVHLPVTTKPDLQALPVEARLSSAFDRDRLQHLRTTGSTGYPFDIYREPAADNVRKAAFLRCLANGRYRYPMRLLGTAHEPKTRSRALQAMRWRYISITSEPPDFIGEIRRYRPHIIYGSVTSIRKLVEYLDEQGLELPRALAVYTTAEALDRRTRMLIERYLGNEAFEIYGMTECGALAWECPAHDGLHMAEDINIFEFSPSPRSEASSLAITNLDLYCMPLIRYEVGDMVALHPGGSCSCGCRFGRLSKVEGRMFDTVTLSDGREVSPIHLTEAIELVSSIRRYQIIQDKVDEVTVRVQLFDGDRKLPKREISEVLSPHLGPSAKIEVDLVDSLEPPPGVKFRTVDNRLHRRAES